MGAKSGTDSSSPSASLIVHDDVTHVVTASCSDSLVHIQVRLVAVQGECAIEVMKQDN